MAAPNAGPSRPAPPGASASPINSLTTRSAARKAAEQASPGGAGLDGPALGAAIAVHLGEVTYGNVGSDQRLDFTVIGPAANQVARLNGFCKVLDTSILVSERVAAHLSRPLRSLGSHKLRGIEGVHEIFTVSQENSDANLQP